MFVFGIVLALPGTVLGLPDVVDRLGLTLARARRPHLRCCSSASSRAALSRAWLSMLPATVTALAASAGLVALCLPLFAAASSYLLAAAALAAIGFASAGINTASNALSSELFPEERGRRMNGLAIAVGVGGLVPSRLDRAHGRSCALVVGRPWRRRVARRPSRSRRRERTRPAWFGPASSRPRRTPGRGWRMCFANPVWSGWRCSWRSEPERKRRWQGSPRRTLSRSGSPRRRRHGCWPRIGSD